MAKTSRIGIPPPPTSGGWAQGRGRFLESWGAQNCLKRTFTKLETTKKNHATLWSFVLSLPVHIHLRFHVISPPVPTARPPASCALDACTCGSVPRDQGEPDSQHALTAILKSRTDLREFGVGSAASLHESGQDGGRGTKITQQTHVQRQPRARPWVLTHGQLTRE